MQMRGYAEAFRDPRLADGIAGGPLGAIAVTMFVWSDWNIQNTLVPWMKLEDHASCERFARAIDGASRETYLYTSISGAIDYASAQFGQRYEGMRRVVDVSGDGVNNSGPPADRERDAAVAEGIVINGLPIVNDRPTFGRLPPVPLDDYYRENVIGGDGSFMIVAEDFESFGVAVKRKLIREIAGLSGPMIV